MEKEIKKTKCPNCDYEWKSKSKLNSITCPNCQRKFERKENGSKTTKNNN